MKKLNLYISIALFSLVTVFTVVDVFANPTETECNKACGSLSDCAIGNENLINGWTGCAIVNGYCTVYGAHCPNQ